MTEQLGLYRSHAFPGSITIQSWKLQYTNKALNHPCTESWSLPNGHMLWVWQLCCTEAATIFPHKLQWLSILPLCSSLLPSEFYKHININAIYLFVSKTYDHKLITMVTPYIQNHTLKEELCINILNLFKPQPAISQPLSNLQESYQVFNYH